MADTILWHNPGCSKSLATLARLASHGCRPLIRDYLREPPDAAELQHLAHLLGCSLCSLVRCSDRVYRDRHGSAPPPDEATALDLLLAEPALLQRPIVVRGDEAVLGRPPEEVDRLFDPTGSGPGAHAEGPR